MRLFTGAFFAALFVAPQLAHAQDAAKGASTGDACGAHADCGPGLRCVRNVCEDEATFVASTQALSGETNKDDGAHGFVAFAVGASLPVALGGGLGEGAQLALRAGVFLSSQVQLQLEVSPVTTVLANVGRCCASGGPMSLFDATATIAFMAPISDMVSWIVRAGGGGGAIFGLPGAPLPFGELRIDVVGVAIRPSKHVLIELNVPSFRVLFLSPNDGNANLMWVTNVAFGYVF